MKWEDESDAGLTGDEALNCQVGDIITFAQTPIQLQGKFMAGKTWMTVPG